MGVGEMQSVERKNSGEELFIFRAKGRVSLNGFGVRDSHFAKTAGFGTDSYNHYICKIRRTWVAKYCSVFKHNLIQTRLQPISPSDDFLRH